MKLIRLLSLALLVTVIHAAATPRYGKYRPTNWLSALKHPRDTTFCGQICTGHNDCLGGCQKCDNFVCKCQSPP